MDERKREIFDEICSWRFLPFSPRNLESGGRRLVGVYERNLTEGVECVISVRWSGKRIFANSIPSSVFEFLVPISREEACVVERPNFVSQRSFLFFFLISKRRELEESDAGYRGREIWSFHGVYLYYMIKEIDFD